MAIADCYSARACDRELSLLDSALSINITLNQCNRLFQGYEPKTLSPAILLYLTDVLSVWSQSRLHLVRDSDAKPSSLCSLQPPPGRCTVNKGVSEKTAIRNTDTLNQC